MTKILFLAANPLDTDPLRLDTEVRAIDISLRQADFRGLFELRSQWAVRMGDLQDLLLRHQPDIVHFSGHGSAASEIVLQDAEGHGVVVPQGALSDLFAHLRDGIRCVVLNACYSADQAEAIAEHVDCVVGMADAITDTASIEFAAAFYRALGYGRSVKEAFDLGCNQIDLAALNEAHKPVLLGCTDAETVFLATDREERDKRMSQEEHAQRPWWDQLAAGATDLDVGGDMIIANVGAGARNVAVGKNIQQTIYETVGEPMPDDKAVIQEQLAAFKRSLDESHLPVAQFPIQMLEAELTKTGDDEAPSGSVIMQAGDFLIDNLPDIAEALSTLFAVPAVGRVLGKAGQETINWLRERFG
jgi:hypothetical protein